MMPQADKDPAVSFRRFDPTQTTNFLAAPLTFRDAIRFWRYRLVYIKPYRLCKRFLVVVFLLLRSSHNSNY